MSFNIDLMRKQGDARIRLQCQTGDGITALIGPSGVGKTTILNMIAGITKPDQGHISVGGRALFDSISGVDVPIAARHAGYVFQDRRLFPHMRVQANLCYARRQPRLVELDAIAELLGITGLMRRWPATLSGGEAQRVAIGRALLSTPRFLLLDEPLTALDEARRKQIRDIIKQIKREFAIPIMLVTHDSSDVEQLADTVVPLSRG